MINSYQMISNVNNETVKNVKGKNTDEGLKTANQETLCFYVKPKSQKERISGRSALS